MCKHYANYDHQVPMPIAGRVRCIDKCIAHIIAALNAANIVTIESCCGHGHLPGYIMLNDGRVLHLTTSPEMERQMRSDMQDKWPNIHGKWPDKNGEF